ncbi:hypothetical protein GH714_009855 [Hevea brasiliensis]|uniref:Protein kinase domain-containing protein n=1 Tax=Hevea brasiliensis TaxID=3981 RepID=A0A6A6MHM9_HEVBR|nr:hypothetical protein GH714_009855 [Hevea brasiliensis]
MQRRKLLSDVDSVYRYVLGEQLGWGRFGVIRACSDKESGEVLACKSIAKDRLVTLEDVRSVNLEIEIMTRGELFHRVEKHGRFSENESWVIFRNLMQVVQHCHENGIVHRDLKPENILLATKPSSSLIKLADFGLATYIKPGHNLHGTVGSPFYIAPEVLAGGYNRAADVWSAGVILYVFLSGMPPFWGKTKSRIFDAVRGAGLQFPPDQWDQISTSAKYLITGMLCVDPSKRLSAAQVLEPTQESYKHDNIDFELVEMGRGSFPILFISRVQDYSFSYESSVIGEGQEEQSPAFTSFSSLVVDSNTPCSATGGFSFRKCDESGATDFPSPIQSMLSFTFFSPNSAIEKIEVAFGFNSIESNMGSVHGETSVSLFYFLFVRWYIVAIGVMHGKT